MRGLFPRPLEITMVTRRIVTSVCALCLAIPAAAVASPGTDQPKAQGPYGVTPVPGAPTAAKAKGPYGVAPVPGSQITANAKGPYGVAPVPGSQIAAKAKGPYGITPVNAGSITASGTAHRAPAARSDSTAGWRIVALCEAALLAAVALGAVQLVAARRRAPRMVT
jgi:hypothetical protein